MKINLYDFDKTIYDGDSSVNFYLFCVFRKPVVILNIPRMAISVIKYKLKLIEKTEMKENIFRFLKYLDNTDELVIKFWDKNESKIKDFYLDKNHEEDVIISASPEFLLKGICEKLNVKMLIASRVDIKTGKFDGLNCHDVEKVRRLNEVMTDYEVMESYSDSLSDIPILKLAKKSYLVKKNNLIPTDFHN